MILNTNIKNIVNDDIVKICKEEIKKNDNKELLGLTVNYFYDGEVIDIGCGVHIFDNNKDEGYTKYISFTLNEDEVDSDLLILLKGYNKKARFNAIEECAKEIKCYLESIDWSSIVKIADEMFIDLKLYD